MVPKIIPFYFAYFGGKKDEFKLIAPYIDFEQFTKIIEPFCGSCGFSLQCYGKYPDKEYFAYDLDTQLMEFLIFVKNNGSAPLFDHVDEFLKNYNKETLKEKFKEYKRNTDIYNYFTIKKLARMGRDGSYDYDRPETSSLRRTGYEITDKYFSCVNLGLQNYLISLERFKDDKNALIFCDPPYFDSYNMGYTDMVKGDNSEIYIKIRDFMKECQCGIILIVNNMAIMKDVFKDFIIAEYDKTYAATKRKTRHMLVGVNVKDDLLKIQNLKI